MSLLLQKLVGSQLRGRVLSVPGLHIKSLKTSQWPAQNSNLFLAKKLVNSNFQITRKRTEISIKEYKSSRTYTGLWKAERFAGYSLLFLIPAIFYVESQELEMALASVAILHSYWGGQSMCNDYVRSSVVGKLLPVVVRLFNIVVNLATLAGAYYLIYEDCGIANMIKMFWSIRGNDAGASPS